MGMGERLTAPSVGVSFCKQSASTRYWHVAEKGIRFVGRGFSRDVKSSIYNRGSNP